MKSRRTFLRQCMFVGGSSLLAGCGKGPYKDFPPFVEISVIITAISSLKKEKKINLAFDIDTNLFPHDDLIVLAYNKEGMEVEGKYTYGGVVDHRYPHKGSIIADVTASYFLLLPPSPTRVESECNHKKFEADVEYIEIMDNRWRKGSLNPQVFCGNERFDTGEL